MVRSIRRTGRRVQNEARSSVRIRSSGFGLLAGVAIAGAAAVAFGGVLPRAPGERGAEPVLVAGNGSAATASKAVAVVPDVPWLVQLPDGGWVHGRGTHAAPRRLPAGETGLAVDAVWVASVLPADDGRSTVRFRDRDTGRIFADVHAPIWVSAGAWTSAGLVVTGYGDRSMTDDGGLLLIAPASQASTVLITGGAFDARLGRRVARGDVLVSPSGRLVASNACGVALCDTQVVDVASGSIQESTHATEGFLRVLTDDALITTDGDASWIAARRIADGGEAWRRRQSILLDPMAAANGSIVAVTGSQRGGWGVAAIDRLGTARDLGPRSRGGTAIPRIWTALSAPSSVVLAGQPFAEWVGSGRTLSVTVLGVGVGPAAPAMVDVRVPPASEWLR